MHDAHYVLDRPSARAMRNALVDAEQRLTLDLAEAIYGYGADQRVYDLRRSVLGDAAGPGPNRLIGLSEIVGGK